MPEAERRPFCPEAGAFISDDAGRLLLVRYRDQPHVWSAPRQPIRFGGEPTDAAILAALNHACAGVEIMSPPWYSDHRVPELGIHDIVFWYQCRYRCRAINVPREWVLESAWVHPATVLLHPLMTPASGQSEMLARRALRFGFPG
jgi:hypothetical protein